MNRYAFLLLAFTFLAASSVGSAATFNVPTGSIATGSSTPVFITVNAGESFTLKAVAPPITARYGFTWRNPDIGIPRFGGVILGYDETLTTIIPVAGQSRITLTYSVNTGGRFYRTAVTYVYITAIAP